MRTKIEIEIDIDLVQEVIRRYQLADAREAVHLALRTLLGEPDDADNQQHDDEFDEFSDPSAWEPHHRSDTG
jgi:Arc/MetJ family transcription regulator